MTHVISLESFFLMKALLLICDTYHKAVALIDRGRRGKTQKARIISPMLYQRHSPLEASSHNLQICMNESHDMQQSAENNTTGKTMGDLIKRNAPRINKTTKLDTISQAGNTFHQTAHFPTYYHHHPCSFLPSVFTYQQQYLFEGPRISIARSRHPNK